MAKCGLRLAGIGLLLLAWLGTACAAPPASLTLATGNEVSFRGHGADGDLLLLWFACDEGHGTHEAAAADGLAARGMETWLPDMLSAHFLPTAPSSIEQIPAEEIAEVIDRSLRLSGKKRVALITAGHGALPVLKGAKLWQRKHPGDKGKALVGAVLFYPDLYSVTPAPGIEAKYNPIVYNTKLPLYIYQGQRSPGRWWLEHLKEALSTGGSTVQTAILLKVRGYFYARQDPTPEEDALANRLPEIIGDALTQMDIAH